MYDKRNHNRKPNQQQKQQQKPRLRSDYTVNDLFGGKDLEIVVASLLLLGKLKVDSVEIFRSAPTVNVTLVGAFTTPSSNEGKSNAMAEFLKNNGDMTLDEVFEGIKKRMNNNGGN